MLENNPFILQASQPTLPTFLYLNLSTTITIPFFQCLRRAQRSLQSRFKERASKEPFHGSYQHFVPEGHWRLGFDIVSRLRRRWCWWCWGGRLTQWCRRHSSVWVWLAWCVRSTGKINFRRRELWTILRFHASTRAWYVLSHLPDSLFCPLTPWKVDRVQYLYTWQPGFMRGKRWSYQASICEKKSFRWRRKKTSTSSKWANEDSTMLTTTPFSSFPNLFPSSGSYDLGGLPCITNFHCLMIQLCPTSWTSWMWVTSIICFRLITHHYSQSTIWDPFRSHWVFWGELYRLYFGSISVGLPKYVGRKAASGNILNYSCICRDNNWSKRALKLECFLPTEQGGPRMNCTQWNITRGTRRKHYRWRNIINCPASFGPNGVVFTDWNTK